MSLINSAFAATTTSAQSSQGIESTLVSFLPMIVIFILFWFLLIRPQQKKAREQNNMIAALQKGDEVVTQSGILGKIEKVGDIFISIEIANNVMINVQKSTVSVKVEKGTYSKTNS